MKITSLFSDKPYSALAIAVCFAVMLILPWLHSATSTIQPFISLRIGSP